MRRNYRVKQMSQLHYHWNDLHIFVSISHHFED